MKAGPDHDKAQVGRQWPLTWHDQALHSHPGQTRTRHRPAAHVLLCASSAPIRRIPKRPDRRLWAAQNAS